MFGFLKKKDTRPFITAVIAAGGASSRMGGENKLKAEVGGIPVLARSLLAFENNSNIDEIIIAAREDMLVEYADMARAFDITKATHVVAGGASRTESVYKGVCAADPKAAYVLVHDGARPLVGQDVIDRVIDGVIKYNCAGAAVKVSDTIRLDNGDNTYTLGDREKMRAMQTPQGGDRQLLAAALKHCIDEGISITDDLAALEELGAKPVLTEGSYRNIKITTREDLAIAEALLEEEI